MFQKLHRQMTFFCSVVTGTILIGLGAFCLLFAEKTVIQAGYTSFQKELSTLLANLWSQDYISHQWLRQMQNEHHLTIFLYDNGEPIYYERLQSDRPTDAEAVIGKLKWNIFKSRDSLSTAREEFPFRRADGTRCYASAGYLTRGDGRISFVILYDRTHELEQIARLRLTILAAGIFTFLLLIGFSWVFTGRMLLPLEISQKKQQQFVAAASHELRSPLAVILSGLESAEKADTPEEARHFLSLIRQEGERMRHLISDMLLLANADAQGIPTNAAPLLPDELLLSVYEKYESLAMSKRIFLKLLLPNESYSACTADKERLTQLLTIFLDNALSYTPAGGKILLLLAQSRGQTTFTVADNGPSISDEDKVQIFERFYRGDSSHTGGSHFGLGLCTAQEIARALHGKILVQDLRDCPLLPKDFAKESGVAFSFTLHS